MGTVIKLMRLDLPWPGPAGTVEEHSLPKIFVRGDRGSIPAEEASFQTAKRTYV